jgi:hypothetical protein
LLFNTTDYQYANITGVFSTSMYQGSIKVQKRAQTSPEAYENDCREDSRAIIDHFDHFDHIMPRRLSLKNNKSPNFEMLDLDEFRVESVSSFPFASPPRLTPHVGKIRRIRVPFT